MSEAIEIDLRYQGTERAICAFADLGAGWLVDPGPELTCAQLLAGLPDDWHPRRILLTHVHFDHAGATGRLLERWPGTEVWVHEKGAPHLIDPSRLLASATRIWPDFGAIWGEVVPVPEADIRVVDDAGAAFDGLRVVYTPGHASHHVTYLDEDDGTAYVGDVAGVRIGDGPTLVPSPPPDIDRELWLRSLDLVESLRPARLAIAHFGTVAEVGPHLEEFRRQLHRWSALAREVDGAGYAEASRREVEATTSDPPTLAAYERGNPPDILWSGWDRYWRSRDSAPQGR